MLYSLPNTHKLWWYQKRYFCRPKRVHAQRTLKRVCGGRPEEGTALTFSLMSMSTFSCKWSLDRTLAIGPRTKSFFEKAPTHMTEQNCQIHFVGSTINHMYNQKIFFEAFRGLCHSSAKRRHRSDSFVGIQVILYCRPSRVFDWNSFYFHK